jgi:hypothetical protein
MKSFATQLTLFVLAIALLPAPAARATAFSLKDALASGAKEIVIPAGRHPVGPEPLKIPGNTLLRGEGPASVLVASDGARTLLQPASGSRLENFAIDGTRAAKGSATESALLQINRAARVSVEGIGITGADRVCIGTDNTDEVSVSRCSFESIGMAINIVYSKRVRIADNRVADARLHGIQIWGAWRPVVNGRREWRRKACEDIVVTGNYVKNGGDGAIWGTGVKRAVFANNIVDGAADAGLDLEWSEDSVITANTVRDCANAGIALFFACSRIGITGNTIINDHPLPQKTDTSGWWVRSGIWLTSPNRKEFSEDHGHENITLTGNTITGDANRRRGIWIGREARSVTLDANTFSNLGVEYENQNSNP